MRVFDCAWKINFPENIFQLTVKLRPLTWKMNASSILPSNHFRAHRHAEREREREREKREERERRPLDFVGEPRAHIAPHPRRAGEIAPSSSRRGDCPTEIIGAIVLVLDPKLIGAVVTDLVLVAHWRRRYRSRSRCSSASLLLISFSFWPKAHRCRRSRRLDLIASMILSSRSHRTNDLVILISSSSLFP